MASATDEMSGKAKKVAGKVTGNKSLEMKGKVQETAGKAEAGVERAGDAMVDVRDRDDRDYQRNY
jgi:uncharacterized protein YjbJ (UPF0337 family)